MGSIEVSQTLVALFSHKKTGERATSSPGLFPQKMGGAGKGPGIGWSRFSSYTLTDPGCNKLAPREKLKLCVTSQPAILGDLLYLLINEKVSFLSQILAMVIFCFPPISMKGTASGNICKTSVYRAI